MVYIAGKYLQWLLFVTRNRRTSVMAIIAKKIYFSGFFFVAIIILCYHTKNGYCSKNPDTFDLIIITLYRDIKFMFERLDQLNVDAIFGLNFAEVHTTAVLDHVNSIFLNQNNRQMLEEISKLCKLSRISLKHILFSSDFERMIRPELWNHTIVWRRGALGSMPLVTPGLNKFSASALIFEGTPIEAESSHCLRDLLKIKNIECSISEECADMLVRKDSSRGYPLTHRLLYTQTATALGCKETARSPLAKLKKNYCVSILQDLIDIEAANFPPPSSDLAMEQILLCGMEGYLEFVDIHYAKLIAGWPNSHGCYSALGFRNGKSYRRKRSTSLMDYGCDNHASGVAAASLSIILRATVENLVYESL